MFARTPSHARHASRGPRTRRGRLPRPPVLAVAAATLALLAPTQHAMAQAPTTGFLDRVVTIDGHAYPYQVYVPRHYSTDAPLPVILFLHGAGERGSDGLLQTAVGLAPAIRRAPDRFPAIVVFPQSPTDSTWTGAPARAAMAALDRTMTEFATDPRRVYLTGLSMGGNGSWYLAYRHPERFAAAIVICGWVAPRRGLLDPAPVVPTADAPVAADAPRDAPRDPPLGTPRVAPRHAPHPAHQALARRLADARLPVWIVHGEVDPVVPVDDSRAAAAALRQAGADVHFSELPGIGHNAWDPAFASDAITTWLFAQRRGTP